jgi:hypothetical protein
MIAERRAEDRSPESGVLRISFQDPHSITIAAELVEISQRGFRATHDSKKLTAGLEVQYSRGDQSSGRARVIWTHILEGRCVSGFLLL